MRILQCILLFVALPMMVQAAIVDEQAAKFRQDLHWSGLNGGVALRFAPNGEVFIAEKTGRVLVLDSVTAEYNTAKTVIDLRDKTFSWHDRGLLSLAIHPEWPEQPFIFVFVSLNRLEDIDDNSDVWPSLFECPATSDPYCGTAARLIRVRVNPVTKSGGEEQILISDWCSGGASHQVGDLVWASTGGLYLSAGEGSAIISFADVPVVDVGSPSDLCYRNDDARLQGSFRAQHDDYLHGKILYIEAELLLEDRELSLEEGDLIIVAKGLRNPFRMTIDETNGDLFIADVGEARWEEINKLTNPIAHLDTGVHVVNFGWPCVEGTEVFQGIANRERSVGSTGDVLASATGEGTTQAVAVTDDDGVCAVEVILTPFDATSFNDINVGASIAALCAAVTDEAVDAWFMYDHSGSLSEDYYDMPIQQGSPTGLAFYRSNDASELDGALFFVDNALGMAFFFDEESVAGFSAMAPTPLLYTPDLNGQFVDLQMGAGDGRLYTVDFFSSSVYSITVRGSNNPPLARLTSSTIRESSAPATFTIDASKSTEFDDDDRIIEFAWDLNGDGEFDDAVGTSSVIERTFQKGVHNVGVRVTDTTGRNDTTSLQLSAGVSITIDASLSVTSGEWTLADTIKASGTARTESNDEIDGELIQWELSVDHCVLNNLGCVEQSSCHSHRAGVAMSGTSASFLTYSHPLPNTWKILVSVAHPDYPEFIEKQEIRTNAKIATVVMNTIPIGLPLAHCYTTPCTLSAMSGSTQSVTAPAFASSGEQIYQFVDWHNNDTSMGVIDGATINVDGLERSEITAVYTPLDIDIIDFEEISAPTAVVVLSTFRELRVSWEQPFDGGDTLAGYVIFLHTNNSTRVYASSVSASSMKIYVNATIATFRVQVAALDACMRLGPRSVMSLPVFASTENPSGTSLSCDVCFDQDRVIADFNDEERFEQGLSNLGTTIGHAGELSLMTFERVLIEDEFVAHLVPTDESGLYFVLGSAEQCFEARPHGYHYTSLEFDIQAPIGAGMDIIVQGNSNGDCFGERSEIIRWRYESSGDEKQQISIRVNAQDFAQGVNAILLTSFSSDKDYYLDNMRLHRDCELSSLDTLGLDKSYSKSNAAHAMLMNNILVVSIGLLLLVFVIAVLFVRRRRRIARLRHLVLVHAARSQPHSAGLRGVERFTQAKSLV